MRTKWWTIAMIVLQLFAVHCVQEIPFIAGKGVQSLVVNGGISTLEEDHIVYLNRTVEYGVPPESVTQAEVILQDDKGQQWQFTEVNTGKYQLFKSFFNAEIGASYFLNIKLQNGTQYRSEAEMILPTIYPDSLSWDINDEIVKNKDGNLYNIEALQLFVHTPLIKENKNIFLRWASQSAYQFTTVPDCSGFRTTYTCYFSNPVNPGNLYIFSNKQYGQNELRRFKIGYESLEPNYRFLETHFFSVTQHRISEQAYEYYRKLELVANQNGSVFDAIPATVRGNVYNVNDKNERVLGYFQVSSAAVIRLKLVQADFDGQYVLLSKEHNLCGWLRGDWSSQYFEGCCNCFSLPDPLIVKPDWW